jgi:hypothetical protein
MFLYLKRLSGRLWHQWVKLERTYRLLRSLAIVSLWKVDVKIIFYIFGSFDVIWKGG